VEAAGDGWSVKRDDGWSFHVPAYGGEPRVGDAARFYGPGIGATVRGVFINGVEAFYRTAAEEAERHRKWVEDLHAEQQKELDEARADRDRRRSLLPEPLRLRLDRFEAADANFRRDSEAYELFCCEQGVVIKDALGTAEAVKEFNALPWAEQVARVPGLSDDHSGNTFFGSCGLAVALIDGYPV
jgi:hypothetical protein